jgi:N-acetylglutamate synthase-like GNAT family acetyltransferase
MDVNFLNFNKKYSNKFYDLNIEWLESYFYVEEHDRSILSNPEEYIINKGGSILFVSCSNKIVGTVALMPTSDIDTYELTKMAVDPSYRGKKIGQRLLEKIIYIAREKKLSKIILYSNKRLENAIYLYNKYKFIEIQLEKNCPYKRANIKMELSI